MQFTPDNIIGSLIGLTIAFLWAFSISIFDSQSGKIKPIAITSFKIWLALGVTSIVAIWQMQTEYGCPNCTGMIKRTYEDYVKLEGISSTGVTLPNGKEL